MAAADTTATMVKAPYTQLHPLPAGVVAVYGRDFDVIDAAYVRPPGVARLPHGRLLTPRDVAFARSGHAVPARSRRARGPRSRRRRGTPSPPGRTSASWRAR